MHWSERRQRFRALIAGERCVHPASVFDPISAHIAEDLGFEAGMLAGSVASMVVLGAPDLILITLSEFAALANRICRAGDLALLVDADPGYGNALNVKRTVEELETAGVAALSIEDTVLPQPFGAGGETRLIPVEEGVAKLRAALAGRQDPDLVIAGRTSAMAVAGVDETVARAKAYQAAGVDAIFLIGVRGREQLEAVSAAVNLPIFLGGAGPELMDLAYLSAQGVRICLQGHQPFLAAVAAAEDTLKALRAGTPPAKIAAVASPDTLRALTRNEAHRRWIKDFLGGE